MSTTPENPASIPSEFDSDAMRERYRIERDKRLRPDGIEQYIEVTGQFAKYLDDPYVERIDRDPIEAEHEVVLIGGGFGGLQAGARLREAGTFEGLEFGP